jgi:hypothetical protein
MEDLMLRLTIITVGALTLCACTGSPNGATADAGMFGTTTAPGGDCKGLGFRGPTPGSVVCPGSPSCACTGYDICCLQAVDSSKGTCEALGGCRVVALQCDGPEDCNPQTTHDQSNDGGPDADITTSTDASTYKPQVCCLDEAQGMTGGGSSCRASNACSGKVLCRSDDDCTNPNLPHCRPADYGTPGVEDRGLDGLVGICQK